MKNQNSESKRKKSSTMARQQPYLPNTEDFSRSHPVAGLGGKEAEKTPTSRFFLVTFTCRKLTNLFTHTSGLCHLIPWSLLKNQVLHSRKGPSIYIWR